MATPLEQLEGKYELLEKIREGGMGSVYKVRHRLLDEIRVIKVMRPQLADDETLKARFLREAKMAIRLHHPNLAQIYDFTMDENGYAYLVMEFIDGFNLEEVIKVLGKPSLGLVLEIADQTLDAIAYLHRKRVIHRDISPDNILVTRDEDGVPRIKLIDLGIAKDREGEDSLTSAGTFLGKVRYSSPEHFRTHEGAPIGARSDLYSFGVVLYELLTGTYPIKGANIASLISGHLMHPPLDFDTSDPEARIPEPLRSIVLKAMAKQPDDRFDSADSFRMALALHRAEHPVEQDQVRAIFEIPTLTTRSIRTIKPGSTQSRIDRSFGLSPTPPPGDLPGSEDDIESSGTIETGSGARTPTSDPNEATANQVRALLLGASKLVEGRHFDEARLQLATVLELEPDNPDAKKLFDAAEAADVKLQQRRQRSAETVKRLIDAEDFEAAQKRLGSAIEADGEAKVFDNLRAEIGAASERRERRLRKIAEMTARAGQSVADGAFEEAAAVLRDALEIDPDNADLRSRLDDAEAKRREQIEAKRRAKEIEDTASTIAGHIEREDGEEAERALAVAVKLYGEQEAFSDLVTELEKLRTAQRHKTAEKLRDTARKLIEAADFTPAIEILEEAHGVEPEAAETGDLLAAAREGLRLQDEARKRQTAIDETRLKIDRLIQAGRLDSAVHLLEETIEEIGDFDEAAGLRTTITSEMKSVTSTMDKVRLEIEQALEHSAADRFSEAEEVLVSARELALDRLDATEMVAETEAEVRRRIDAHRRHMAIDKVVQSVDRQLEKSSPEEALRELAVAKRLYGESDVFDDLAAKIGAKEREIRHQEIDRLVQGALDDNRPIDDVIADLESALAHDPHNEEAHRLLVRAQSSALRGNEDRIEEEAAAALGEIDRLIAGGSFEAALSRLEDVVRTHGDFRTARVLRSRLEAGLDSRP